MTRWHCTKPSVNLSISRRVTAAAGSSGQIKKKTIKLKKLFGPESFLQYNNFCNISWFWLYQPQRLLYPAFKKKTTLLVTMQHTKHLNQLCTHRTPRPGGSLCCFERFAIRAFCTKPSVFADSATMALQALAFLLAVLTKCFPPTQNTPVSLLTMITQ